jgi:hypothetical protein
MPYGIIGHLLRPKQNVFFHTYLFYPDGPHRGIGFKKAINLKACPQQAHLISCFFGISGKSSRMTSWINEISSRIFSTEQELLGLRKP